MKNNWQLEPNWTIAWENKQIEKNLKKKKNRQTNYLEDFNRFPKSQKDKTLGDVIQNYWTCKELGKNLLKFQEKHSQEMPILEWQIFKLSDKTLKQLL